MRGNSFVKTAVLAIPLFLVIAISVGFREFKPQVIYGSDDRQDLHAVTDPALLDLADSTVSIFHRTRLIAEANDMFRVNSKQYGHDYNLCTDEVYYDQPTAAACSAFLVGEDLVATAGHCISEVECPDYVFAFGYNQLSANKDASLIPTKEFYNCKEVVAHELTHEQDYALIRLDRKVEGHKPLKLAQSSAAEGDEVVLIGNPAGLPTKVAAGATVRSQKGSFFVTNTDSYGGNSGSAVFNAKTHEVIGILVRGEIDFVYDQEKSCTKSYYCNMDDCRGEDVTNIHFISDALSKLVPN